MPFLPLLLLAAAVPDEAPEEQNPAIVVTGESARIENPPATAASVDAETIATTVNAMNVEDALKYLPSLVLRKRHIGDTQAPLATRTSGLGASARSLVYADGVLLSALIGNNNTSASPRWGMVSTEEIARIDVLYGPYSAAYPGNSIGAVVKITTRLPDRLEATANAGVNVQPFRLYGTDRVLSSFQLGGTIGDRFGPLAFFASVDHVDSQGQPLGFVTAARGPGGGYDDLSRIGQPIRVIGASGFEQQVQDRIKLKAALDLASDLRLTYVVGRFRNDTDATVESYLRDAAGLPNYSSAFASGIYRTEQAHWSHSLSLTGGSAGFDWQLIGTLYHVARDEQRVAGTAPPAGAAGGRGTITRLDGTGWQTLDAKGGWRLGGAHRLGFGAHADWFALDSRRYDTADWLRGTPGALNLRSAGRTRTLAFWAQDEWMFAPALALTFGVRQEWWRASAGLNYSLSPLVGPVAQPGLSAVRFSPKASLAWDVAAAWRIRLSAGQAWRFPTVGELYQIVTTPVPAVPNPNLRPERARSAELAFEWHDAHGTLRLSLFDEQVKDALISQTGPLPGSSQLGTYVQNVDRTRARGVEFVATRIDAVPGVDLSGSVTYADAITKGDAAFPGAVGKRLPSVPRWKLSGVATWRPAESVSLTAAARYASRNYGALDNSDIVGNTYQGFYKYLVVDIRARFRLSRHVEFGLGADNLGNDRYFLFHPFPQRSLTADMKVVL
ncbi:TonB-dependent receptor [Sphingomonas sp.]|uniref:TonB-dependent receptor n=1 Tax=Sphingomonas sp. TaxID=28214 RepID=UPI001B2EF224|nr:TonB-dependent receptor [Sphingomonas sp.]MBO9713857.1 TonB-dependent receptor [Sphingomonas sp.]